MRRTQLRDDVQLLMRATGKGLRPTANEIGIPYTTLASFLDTAGCRRTTAEMLAKWVMEVPEAEMELLRCGLTAFDQWHKEARS